MVNYCTAQFYFRWCSSYSNYCYIMKSMFMAVRKHWRIFWLHLLYYLNFNRTKILFFTRIFFQKCANNVICYCKSTGSCWTWQKLAVNNSSPYAKPFKKFEKKILGKRSIFIHKLCLNCGGSWRYVICAKVGKLL